MWQGTIESINIADGAKEPMRAIAEARALPGVGLEGRSEEHTSELQSQSNLVCRLLLEKKNNMVGLGGKSAADKGNDTRYYLAAACRELNAWERAGADASSAGMVDDGFENQKELTKMQLDNQKEIAEMQNETHKEIAGIQSAIFFFKTNDHPEDLHSFPAHHPSE